MPLRVTRGAYVSTSFNKTTFFKDAMRVNMVRSVTAEHAEHALKDEAFKHIDGPPRLVPGKVFNKQWKVDSNPDVEEVAIEFMANVIVN